MESGNEEKSLELKPNSRKAAAVTLDQLPEISRKKYEFSYKLFMDWRKNQKATSYSENVLMAYFDEISKKYKASTLWTHYSMLRALLNINSNVDIAKYLKLRTFLKRQSYGYQPKKSKHFTSREINKFIKEAPDEEYLLAKIALIMGVTGACSKHELHQMKTTYFNDLDSAVLVTIPDNKTKSVRTFIMKGHFYTIFKKYISLRPSNVNDSYFFLNYKNGKCTAQKVGINKFGTMGKQIAKYLKLPSPELYTAHCFRKSASIHVDPGIDCGSTTVTNEQIFEFVKNKFGNSTVSVDVGENRTPLMRNANCNCSSTVTVEYNDESVEDNVDNLAILGKISLNQPGDWKSTIIKEEYVDVSMKNEFGYLTTPVDVSRDESSLKEHGDWRSTIIKEEYTDEFDESDNSIIFVDGNGDVTSFKTQSDSRSTTVEEKHIDESMENKSDNSIISVDFSGDITSLNTDDDGKSITVKEEHIDESMESKVDIKDNILSWIENSANMPSTSKAETWENWDNSTHQESSTNSPKIVFNNCNQNMATIEKLNLCGLRSFGPYEDDMQGIKFSTPLTLILGENGCGKTTIIEALKFACSGDVPGGSKGGQGFVNDPKLTSKVSTRGQVRLRISDVKKNKYLVIKSVQVTNKANNPSFKRLDTTLKKVNPDGTFTTISSRCADIDTDICEILGVSKAILNNVVFCHQENAAWPLDEPKKLKEKFDEIFGATEYNKCAENIRKIIKEKETANKILASRVGMLKQTKEIVDKKRSDMHEKEEKLAKTKEIIQQKENSLQPILVRLQEISGLETNLATLQSNCTRKEATKQANIENQKTILKNISTEYVGTDEELQNEIASFETKSGNVKQKLNDLEGRKKSTESQQKQLSGSIAKAQIKLGKLEGRKKLNQSTVEERNELIQTAGNILSIQVPSALDSDHSVSVAIEAIEKCIKTSKTSLEKLTHECDSEESKFQEVVNSNRDKLAKANHSIDSKNQQIREFKGKSREINSQLRELDYSDEQLKTLEQKISRIDADLKNLKSSIDVEAVTKSIDENKQRVREYEEKLETLERDRKLLQQNRITEAELETQRHGLVKRESEIHKLKNKHFENFSTIFAEDIPNPGFIKKAIETHKQSNTNKINDYNKRIKVKQNEKTTLDAKRRFQKQQLQTLERELEENKQQVSELCNRKPFDEECNDLYLEIEKLQKKKGQFSSAKIMYEKFLQDFQKEKPCCPICQTNFTNKETAVGEIIRAMRSNVQNIPQQLQKVDEELKMKQQQYSKVLQLKPKNDRNEELTSTLIPNLKSEVADLNSFFERVTNELKEFEELVIQPQGIVDACNKVIGDAALIDQQQLEITQSQRKIVELESQLVQVSSNRSLQQAEAEIEDTKTDLSNARRNSENSQKKLQQHNDRCQELREERSKHVEKQLQLQKAMQGKPQLQDQLVELSEKEETLNNEIGELKLQLTPLRTELKDAENARDALKVDNRKKMSDAQTELHRSRKFLEDISKLQKSIEVYVGDGGDEAFEAASVEIDKLKEKEGSLEENKKEILNSITEVNKQIATQDSGLRTLRDNLDLREMRKVEKQLSEEIADLKRQIGDHNYRTLLREKQNLRQEEDDLRREISRSMGGNDELQQEINKLKSELNAPDNKQAHTNYKKVFIEHSVGKEGAQNLHLYLKALEIGILTFHKERMNQINKIIRQLWRSIYRGNDCDYIEIKTEDTKSTGLRRTYNYKVVQIKSDVEIEMRGRCSAGQKVLACLVIRMALAETFSKNCGILALDEPTTNLDRANITSLSEALARIVNARQAERNFQLLVITHDEEFLSALTRVDKVSHFWRVSRNNKGNSIVQKETI